MGSKLEGDKKGGELKTSSTKEVTDLNVRVDVKDKILEVLRLRDLDDDTKSKVFNILGKPKGGDATPTSEEVETQVRLSDTLKALNRQKRITGEDPEPVPTSLTTYPAYSSEEKNIAG